MDAAVAGGALVAVGAAVVAVVPPADVVPEPADVVAMTGDVGVPEMLVPAVARPVAFELLG